MRNNQKGESLLLVIFCLFIVSSLCLMLFLKLKNEDALLEKRFSLTLCQQFFDGEQKIFLKEVSQLNWAIKNADNIKLIALFIPGMQGLTGTAEEVKKLLQLKQNTALLSFLKKKPIQTKLKCTPPPFWFMSPIEHNFGFITRTSRGLAKLRSEQSSWFLQNSAYQLISRWHAKRFGTRNYSYQSQSYFITKKVTSL